MDKSEKILRKNLKITAKRNQICAGHNVIFVKRLNKLDKELDYITNKLTQEIDILSYKSRMSTISKFRDILSEINRLRQEIKYEKRNLDLDGNKKVTYPKRQALVRKNINPLEEIFRELTLYTTPRVEIPY